MISHKCLLKQHDVITDIRDLCKNIAQPFSYIRRLTLQYIYFLHHVYMPVVLYVFRRRLASFVEYLVEYIQIHVGHLFFDRSTSCFTVCVFRPLRPSMNCGSGDTVGGVAAGGILASADKEGVGSANGDGNSGRRPTAEIYETEVWTVHSTLYTSNDYL